MQGPKPDAAGKAVIEQKIAKLTVEKGDLDEPAAKTGFSKSDRLKAASDSLKQLEGLSIDFAQQQVQKREK